jgi:hypothetical protein
LKDIENVYVEDDDAPPPGAPRGDDRVQAETVADP